MPPISKTPRRPHTTQDTKETSEEMIEREILEIPPIVKDNRKKKYNGNLDDGKGLQLPPTTWIKKGDPLWETFDFNESTGLKILSNESSLDIYLNADNSHLLSEIRNRTDLNPNIIREDYKIGMVLCCLGMYYNYKVSQEQEQNNDQDEAKIFDTINAVSIGLAQVILPIIYIKSASKLEETLIIQ